MSMSTKIDDLPGPIPEEIRDDINKLQNSLQSPPPPMQPNIQNEEHIKYEQIAPISNISVDIKKKENNKSIFQNLIDNFKNILSEQNIILFCLFVLSSLSNVDMYLTQIPIIGNYATNNITASVIKGAILLVVYILVKSALG